MKTLLTTAAFISIGLAPVVVQAVEIASADFTDPNNDGELDGDTDGSGWAAGWLSRRWCLCGGRTGCELMLPTLTTTQRCWPRLR